MNNNIRFHLELKETGLKGRDLVREMLDFRGFRDQECLDLIKTKDEPNVQFQMPSLPTAQQ